MTRLLIGFWIVAAVTAVVSVTVFLLRLSAETIELIAWTIVASLVVGMAGLFLLSGAIGYQRFRILSARAKKEEYEAIAGKYRHYDDGFGMVHLLNLDTNTVENLSTYPGSHHNGTWQEPEPAAAAAWFALVGKPRAESPVDVLASQMTVEQKPGLWELLEQYPHVLCWGGTGGGLADDPLILNGQAERPVCREQLIALVASCDPQGCGSDDEGCSETPHLVRASGQAPSSG